MTDFERGEVESVVRKLLEAAGRGRDWVPRLWAGEVAKFVGVQSLDRSTGRPSSDGWRLASSTPAVKRLAVRSIADGSATVDLRAFMQLTFEHRTGRQRELSIHLGGPVRLSRANGRWKVVTLTVDGIDLASSLFKPVPAKAMLGDLNVWAVARAQPRADEFTVAIRNEGSGPAEVQAVFTRRRVCWLFEDGVPLLSRPRVLLPGEVWARTIALKGRLTRMATSIRARSNGEEVRLTLRPPHRSPVHRLRQGVDSNVLLQSFVALAVAAWIAGIDAAVLGFVLLGAGLVLVLGEVLSFLSGTRASGQAFYAMAGLAELLIAGLVFRSEGIGFVAPAVVAVIVLLGHVGTFRTVMHLRRAE